MKKILFVIALISVLLIAGCSETVDMTDTSDEISRNDDTISPVEDASEDISLVDESEVDIGELI